MTAKYGDCQNSEYLHPNPTNFPKRLDEFETYVINFEIWMQILGKHFRPSTNYKRSAWRKLKAMIFYSNGGKRKSKFGKDTNFC